jgi:hypothetical protein
LKIYPSSKFAALWLGGRIYQFVDPAAALQQIRKEVREKRLTSASNPIGVGNQHWAVGLAKPAGGVIVNCEVAN